MKYSFAALRFLEDGNICDRVYWYACEFAVKEGDFVLAPVGTHNRLQCARVERTLIADEKDAPYDMRLIKYAAAKRGAHRLNFNGYLCYDLGGLRYDKKRFTRYGAVLYADKRPADIADMSSYAAALEVTPQTVGECCRILARAIDTVLLCGESADTVAMNLLLLAGVSDADTVRIFREEVLRKAEGEVFFLHAGLTREEIELLKEKLL